MVIYIRHGDDHEKAAEYHHDRRLTERGRRRAREKAIELVDEYAGPVAILASPYRRAIETAKIMSAQVLVCMQADRRLAQHLSQKRQESPDVSPETARDCPIIESDDAFRQRVSEHLEQMRVEGLDQPGVVVWCVTHQVVIEAVGDLLGVKVPRDLDFLDHVVL